MEIMTLNITEREPGKKNTKAIRRDSRIPVVIYGDAVEENIHAAVDFHDITNAFNTSRGRNILCELNLDGRKIRAVPYQLEVHPVKESLMHVDFFAVEEGKEITVTVPLLTEGRSKGQLEGGELIRPQRSIKISCLPGNIPNNISIDITELEIGDKIKISEVVYPDGIAPIYREDVPVVVIREERGIMKETEKEEEEGMDELDAVVGEEDAASAEDGDAEESTEE